jgi:outer membrane protein TolC
MNQGRIISAVLAGTSLFLGGSAAVRAQETEGLTLKRAVALTLQNSREITLARVQYNSALRLAGVDRAEFRPNLFTGSGLAYTHGFPQTPNGAPPSIFGLSYTQALFNPLLRGEAKAAEDRAENQRLEMEKVRDAVMVRAASAYLELAKVRHALDLLRNERTSSEKILEVIRERTGAGLELPIEVTRGELGRAQIEQRLVQLEGREEILDDQLHDLTGIAPEVRLEVAPEDLPALPEQPAAELVDLALENSKDIKEAENERSARDHIFRGDRGAYWPTITAIGQYTVLSKFNNYAEFYNHFERNNVNLGVEIQIPIFSWRTSATVALARSERTAAEIMLGNKRRDTSLDARQKIRKVREYEASREVARLDRKLAQESLADVQARYDQGRASLRDLEQARVEESEKWVAFLDADFARQQAQLALLQSTGQLAQALQ